MVNMHRIPCLNHDGTMIEDRYYPGETYEDAVKLVVDAGYVLATNAKKCKNRDCRCVVKRKGSKCEFCKSLPF